MIPENSIRALTVDIPVTKGTIGVSYSLFGYPRYFESRAALAFGKTFGERLSAGIQINYLMIGQSADYGNMHAVVPEGGLLVRPLDKLYIGFHLFNPARQHFPQSQDQTIPSVMQVGIGYRIIDQVLLCAEAEKATLEKQVWKAGFEYEMIRNLNLRLGVSSAEISRFAIGLGYTFRHFTLDFALSHHQWLGFTPYVTLTRKKDKEVKRQVLRDISNPDHEDRQVLLFILFNFHQKIIRIDSRIFSAVPDVYQDLIPFPDFLCGIMP